MPIIIKTAVKPLVIVSPGFTWATWNPLASYALNAGVAYSGVHYKCILAITPVGATLQINANTTFAGNVASLPITYTTGTPMNITATGQISYNSTLYTPAGSGAAVSGCPINPGTLGAFYLSDHTGGGSIPTYVLIGTAGTYTTDLNGSYLYLMINIPAQGASTPSWTITAYPTTKTPPNDPTHWAVFS